MDNHKKLPNDWSARVKIFDKICKILKIRVGSIEPYD